MPDPIRLAHLAGQPAPSPTPLYRRLAEDPEIDLTVFFASTDGVKPFDDGYGKPVAWDHDLTSGYRAVFLDNAESTPGLGEHTWSARNWDIVPKLVKGRFDALWMAGYNSATYLLAAATQRARGGALLIREEQTLLDRRSLANTVAKQLLLRPYLSQATGLYISTENRRWHESFGVPPERLFEAPYTVDNALFQEAAERLAPTRDDLRERFGIAPSSGPVIATASRLIAKKEPLVLLEAFRRVRERHPCTLLIAGSGPLEADLRREIERNDIPDVVLAGFLNRSEIAEAYAAADVFALVSGYKETFGLVVNEAMNFGLPIVVSDRVGCARDLVSNDYNGYVVEAGSPDAAAAAFERLVTDPELRSRMGRASRDRIDSWDVERTATGILAAVKAAVY